MAGRVGQAAPATSGEPVKPAKREQRRTADTKQAILRTALKEFAERGYEAASMRAIAEQSGLTHQLITYHFQSKEALWQAVAEQVYEALRLAREDLLRQPKPATPIGQLRQEFQAFFQFTIDQPHLHRFMLQRREGAQCEDRQAWLAEHFLRPHFDLLRPLIKAAQKAGDLPPGEPVLLYYTLVSLANTLAVMGPDIEATTGLPPSDAKTVRAYMTLMDGLLFKSGGD